MCFDILNRLGVAHNCDRQTDERTWTRTGPSRPRSGPTT